MKKAIWDYAVDDLIGLVRDHVDAVLAADAEVNEYRTFIRKGMFDSLLGEKGKYTDLINDQYGHAAGDRALRSFAGMIAEQIGDQKAVAGRWGGEEFLIVCFGMTPQELYDLADRIRRQTEKAEFPDVGHFTCSIGLAELRPGDDTPGSAFERADKALYRAKEAGRNRIVTAD